MTQPIQTIAPAPPAPAFPDDARRLWARSSLRQGLPGDGTPRSARAASRACMHFTMQHKILPDPSGNGTWFVRSRLVRAPHVCFGGWEL